MNDWVLLDNPAYIGKEPRPLQAACHDGTPFLTVRCGCGADGHFHEGQLRHAPLDAEVVLRCPACGEFLEFPPGFVAEAFEGMRADGWIANVQQELANG